MTCDVVAGFEDAVRQLIGTHKLPDVFLVDLVREKLGGVLSALTPCQAGLVQPR